MLRIECFHRVLPEAARSDQWPYFTRGTAMTVDDFRRHLIALSETHEFVDEREAMHILGSKETPRRACWITFDDGYLDNLLHAAPVLSELGIRPTLFMTTRALGGDWWPPVDHWYAWLRAAGHRKIEVIYDDLTECWDLSSKSGRARAVTGALKARYIEASDGERGVILQAISRAVCREMPAQAPAFLGREELVELSSRGWFIGPHGHEHRLLTSTAPALLRTELLASHQALNMLSLAHRSRLFAYPDGRFDDVSTSLTRTTLAPLGYHGALTIDGRDVSRGDRPWMLPRHIVGA